MELSNDYEEWKRLTKEIEKLIGEFKSDELDIGKGIMHVKRLPCEAPWLSPEGACLIMITSLRRNKDGIVEFQLGDKNSVPYDNGNSWCRADDFYHEWPQ